MLSRLWARLLKIEDETTITLSSDFFDLGGHSLLLAKLSALLLKEIGATVTIAAIIERPTLKELADLLDAEMTSSNTSTSGSGGGTSSGTTSVFSTPAQRWGEVDYKVKAELFFFNLSFTISFQSFSPHGPRVFFSRSFEKKR